VTTAVKAKTNAAKPLSQLKQSEFQRVRTYRSVTVNRCVGQERAEGRRLPRYVPNVAGVS
jgi:hypothetical protein